MNSISRKHFPKIHDFQSIEIEAIDGCSTGRRQADDKKAVRTPSKVLAPDILARMIKSLVSFGYQIPASRRRVLVAVATGTGQTKIPLVRWPAFSFRDYMLNHERAR